MKESGIAPLTNGNLLRYLGLWLLMSTLYGWKRKDFCSVTLFYQEANPCPYRLGEFMSKRRFNAITRELRFTNTNPPSYVDIFWKIFQMLKAWNDHMTYIFLASWVICLDESMSIWHSRWTCPGWIFCPWKPHPFGNEWHTACCALSGIFFVVEFVEGKAHPHQAVPLEFEDLDRKTVGLLLHMMKSYFATGRYVICMIRRARNIQENSRYAR